MLILYALRQLFAIAHENAALSCQLSIINYQLLSMNVLIIYCHPSRKSYTFQILEHLQGELTRQKHVYKISDLYAMNFQTDMTEQEYEREGFANYEYPIPDDVRNEHQKLDWADCVIFLYPVWWSDCPAKLKGWFDRVYSAGYAYKQTDHFPKMKSVKSGIVLCTAGHPNDYLCETGIYKSMQTVMLDDRLGKRFENKEMIILGGTLDIESVKEVHLSQVTNIVMKLG